MPDATAAIAAAVTEFETAGKTVVMVLVDDVRAGLLPQDKVTAVRHLEKSGGARVARR